jgi:endoglucanase
MGSLIAIKRGTGEHAGAVMPTWMRLVCSSAIDTGGMLRFTNVGGFDDRALLGKVVQVGPRKVTGVIGARAIHLLKRGEYSKVVKIDAMRIDIGAKTKEAASSSVKVGDYAAFVTEYEEIDAANAASQGL